MAPANAHCSPTLALFTLLTDTISHHIPKTMAKTRPQQARTVKRKKHQARHHQLLATRTALSQIQALIDTARLAFDTADLPHALSLAEKAHRLSTAATINADDDATPDPELQAYVLAATVLCAELQLELGDALAARSLVDAAIALDPDGAMPEACGGGAEKFLHAGQLSGEGGRHSLALYETALRILRSRLEACGSEPEEHERKDGYASRYAAACCAVAELYMTDLSWEADAEARCEAALEDALRVAPQSVEALQGRASMRISQERVEEACEALRESMSLWKDTRPDESAYPAFPVRVSLLRLLGEVGMLREAGEVGGELLQEDDSSVEVMYLTGWVAYLKGERLRGGGEEDTDENKDVIKRWKRCWRESRGWFQDCLTVAAQQEYEDERLMEHAAELIGLIDEELGPEDEADPDGQTEDPWDDEEEDEDDEEDDTEHAHDGTANNVEMTDA